MPPPTSASPARARFTHLDAYRAEREWDRYEGTAQRDLFRTLRWRFLKRHAVAGRWSLDVGSGPGRFLPVVGVDPTERVALDLSPEMLRRVRSRAGREVHRVRGDAAHPPFARGAFANVVVLGNTVGFAGEDAGAVVDRLAGLVAPGGRFLLEVVAGPGEHSRYLARLPPTALRRLLRAPPAAVQRRLETEGYVPEPVRRDGRGEFRRFRISQLVEEWAARGWSTLEVAAVAPATGARPTWPEAVRPDAKAWAHLLDLEEAEGREPVRWERAAAVLLAFEAPAPRARTIK